MQSGEEGPTQAKQFACFPVKFKKPLGRETRPSVFFLTENATGPALAVFAFAFGKTHTSLRASSPHASKAVCLLPAEFKKPLGRETRPSVIFLTENAAGPALAVFAFRCFAGAARTQTKKNTIIFQKKMP